MKLTSSLAAAALLASSADALFGGKPPPQPKTDLVKGFAWKDPFKSPAIAGFDAACEAEAAFPALEYSLHNLMQRPPKGLWPWNQGLKAFFAGREYPGSWAGWDKHLHDRSILLMEYADVPLLVRQWIEASDAEGEGEGEGEDKAPSGQGLYAVFEKPADDDDQLTETVKFPKEEDADRAKDANRVAIFAPGAIYPLLPLWVAGSSSCKDDLLDLAKYEAVPRDGAVVGWPVNKEPKGDDNKMEFVVTAKVLKAKQAAESQAGSTETTTRDEL
jgi:hypothetical protein